MAYKRISGTAFECYCERCGYHWKTKLRINLPVCCPKCRDKLWNKKRVRGGSIQHPIDNNNEEQPQQVVKFD